jgi:hypothetical protein
MTSSPHSGFATGDPIGTSADLTDRLLRCPSWCREQENHIHRAGEEDLQVEPEQRRVTFRHHGPSWPGPLVPYGYQDVLTGDCEFHIAFATGDLPEDLVDPDDLRTLAGQITAAADWLRDHQQQSAE